MKKKLSTIYDGNTYDILLNLSGLTGKASITINEEKFENVQKQSATFGCVIYPIKLGETDAELILRNGKLSVAVEGNSIEDGQPVDKGVKPPWWIYLLLAPCAILVFTGGAVGAGAGAGLGMFSYLYACRKDKSKTAKFFVALGSTIAAWAIWLVFVMFIFA